MTGVHHATRFPFIEGKGALESRAPALHSRTSA